MELRKIKSAHCIGIGGINMSAVAKLLLAAGVRVSGSDLGENEQVKLLKEKGVAIALGHAPEHIPEGTEVVIYTSAVPETNPERQETRKRGIPEMTNFYFLNGWFAHHKTILVAGTHGKSTTTSMLGLMMEKAGMDPTVVVGSKVPSFPEGNLRMGASDFFVVEGDEYAKHFLEFHPYGVVLNNIELDHTDVFPTIGVMMDTFRELISKIRYGGILVANVGCPNVKLLLEQEQKALEILHVRVIPFNTERGWNVSHVFDAGTTTLTLHKSGARASQQAQTQVEASVPDTTYRFILKVNGAHNAMNASGAALMALELGAAYPAIAAALSSFTGIWRRFELLRDNDDIRIYSDYGHHPTAVTETLNAAKEMSLGSRVMLCFQPHHRNRTRNLFLDFVTSCDLADALVLCEIYDVAGRDDAEDQTVSSKDLVDAIIRHDADRGVKRLVEYAENPAAAVKRTLELAEPGDVVIIMGAGDIDDAARKAVI